MLKEIRDGKEKKNITRAYLFANTQKKDNALIEFANSLLVSMYVLQCNAILSYIFITLQVPNECQISRLQK